MANRKETKYIVVHCSATRPEMDIGVNDLRKWHQAKGWSDVGYHFVITRSGNLQVGRNRMAIGSHVRGLNAVSVAVCLVGGLDGSMKAANNFTAAQFRTLRKQIVELQRLYPGAKLVGHRDVIQKGDPPKDCPCFDVNEWYGRG